MQYSRYLTYICLVLLSVAILFVNASISQQRNNEVKIGFILPLSGDWAFLGNGIRDAALLAGEDLKNAKNNYKLIFEDNRGELKDSATIVKRLIDTDRVNALVSIISGVGLLINPLVEQAKVLHIGICSNTDVANGEYNFVNYLTAEQGVKKFIKEINRRYPKGIKLAVLSMNEPGFNLIVEELKRKTLSSKIKILSTETFEPKTIDFKSQILRIFKDKPEALLILGISPEIEVIARQLLELGKKVPIMSIEGFGLAENKEFFEEQWFVDAAVPNKSFRNRFKDRFGYEVTAGCGHAYDTVMMLAKAYESVGIGLSKPASNEYIRAFQEIADFKGVLGKVELQQNGIFSTEPSIKFIKNGKVKIQN